MLTVDEVRRHILFKRDGERTLPAALAGRMLDALDRGETPDYQALLRRAAAWMPATVFHTSPSRVREGIVRYGLEARLPIESSHWRFPQELAGQPAGVYVAAEPDRRGTWAHEHAWDVWRINPTGLAYEPDPLNLLQECWVITEDVPADRLVLEGVYSAAVAL